MRCLSCSFFFFFLTYTFDREGNLHYGGSGQHCNFFLESTVELLTIQKCVCKATQELEWLEVIWLLTSSNARGGRWRQSLQESRGESEFLLGRPEDKGRVRKSHNTQWRIFLKAQYREVPVKGTLQAKPKHF